VHNSDFEITEHTQNANCPIIKSDVKIGTNWYVVPYAYRPTSVVCVFYGCYAVLLCVVIKPINHAQGASINSFIHLFAHYNQETLCETDMT